MPLYLTQKDQDILKASYIEAAKKVGLDEGWCQVYKDEVIYSYLDEYVRFTILEDLHEDVYKVKEEYYNEDDIEGNYGEGCGYTASTHQELLDYLPCDEGLLGFLKQCHEHYEQKAKS